MKGYTIIYTPKSAYARTIFNHLLYGRILYRKKRGIKFAYYIPGMLDQTPFLRIMNSKVFITDLTNIDLKLLDDYAYIDVEKTEREFTYFNLKTGEEYWRNRAKEKELSLKRKKTRW